MPDQDDSQKQKELIANADDETVTTMLEFGKVVFAEVLQRSSQIDAKLASYIAYGTGLIALLSFSFTKTNKPILMFVGLIATLIPVCLAVGFSAYGLRARIHEVPGDAVWINKFSKEESLRKSYVIALLRSRQLQRAQNLEKAAAMRYAENALMIGGVPAIAILIYLIFS